VLSPLQGMEGAYSLVADKNPKASPLYVQCSFIVVQTCSVIITILLIEFVWGSLSNPQPPTLNPQPSALSTQPSTLNPQPVGCRVWGVGSRVKGVGCRV